MRHAGPSQISLAVLCVVAYTVCMSKTQSAERLTSTPDLDSFDWIVLNTSGGKDSQAMLYSVAQELKARGLMDRAVVVHCDLGRVEWKGTRDLAERQARALGYTRFEVVSRDRDLLHQIEFERKMFPGSGARFCTSDQKTSQVHKLFTVLHAEARRRQGKKHHTRILSCLGFTPDESPARAAECALVTRNEKKPSNKSKTVTRWYPLHDWTAEKVWDCIRSNELEYHPAYDLGMTRLSCVFCVFASAGDLEVAARANPELLAEYVALEQRLGHTLQHGKSLAVLQTKITEVAA